MTRMTARLVNKMTAKKDERLQERALMEPVAKPESNYERQLENFAQMLGANYANGQISKAYGNCTLSIAMSTDKTDDFVDFVFGHNENGYVWQRTLKIYKPRVYPGELKGQPVTKSESNQAYVPELFENSYNITEGVQTIVRAYECGLNIPQEFIVGLNTFISDFKRAMGKTGRSVY